MYLIHFLCIFRNTSTYCNSGTIKDWTNSKCIISINSSHNHLISSAEALRFRPMHSETKSKLLNLFHRGHSASSAKCSLVSELMIEYSDNYHLAFADNSLLPSVSICQRLLNKEFTKLYGARSEKVNIENL